MSPWLTTPEPRPRARLRLYCLPHAGGGASAYHSWTRELPDFIEVCPVQLPGREGRFREPPAEKIGELVEPIAERLAVADGRPYALFGHSMGAALAFEITAALRDRGARPPLHLFASGFRGPYRAAERDGWSDRTDEAVLEALIALGGLPDDLVRNDEYLRMQMPVIRADLRIAETYLSTAAPVGCPITVFGGTADHHVSVPELEAWRAATTGACVVHMLPGGHFFLRDSPVMVHLLAEALVLAIELGRTAHR